MNHSVNQAIKMLRKTLNMSQKEFAYSVSVKQSSISRIESGNASPDRRTIELICLKHLVNQAWILNGEGEMFISENKSEKNLAINDDTAFYRDLITSQQKIMSDNAETIRMMIEKITMLENNKMAVSENHK